MSRITSPDFGSAEELGEVEIADMGLLNDGLFFIDHRGKSVIARQRQDDLGQFLSSEADVLREAVEEAGWAAMFADPRRSAVNIQFSVERVSEPTLEAISKVLLRHDFKEVLLSYKVLEWQRERHNDSALAAARVWTAVREGDQALARRRVTERSLNPDILLSAEGSGTLARAAALFDAWKSNGGRYFTGLPAMMKALELECQADILEITPDHPGGVFQHIGSDCVTLHNFLGERHRGFPLSAYPDPHIGRWAVARYSSIVQSRRPQLSETSLVRPVLGSLSYHCLRLPWQSDNGRAHMTVMRIRDWAR